MDLLTSQRELEARKSTVGETFADYLHDQIMLANRVSVSGSKVISYIVSGWHSEPGIAHTGESASL